MTKTYEITEKVTLVTETCCSCGVVFAMPESFKERSLAYRGPKGWSFWCPAGHQQFYTGKTDAEVAQEELAKAREQLASQRGWSERLEKDLDAERKSHASTKGQLTKTRRRALAGVCLECHRHFGDVEQHVKDEHPGVSPSHRVATKSRIKAERA